MERAGGVALYLPLRADPEPLLDAIDALLVPGGGDFAPPTPYAEPVAFDLVPAAQLAFDRALLRGALARDLPVLGICYGMQLLALETGGTLHHHLPWTFPAHGPTSSRTRRRDTRSWWRSVARPRSARRESN